MKAGAGMISRQAGNSGSGHKRKQAALGLMFLLSGNVVNSCRLWACWRKEKERKIRASMPLHVVKAQSLKTLAECDQLLLPWSRHSDEHGDSRGVNDTTKRRRRCLKGALP